MEKENTEVLEDESTEEPCEHDYDPDEGFHCINCGAEYPW